jgi:cell division protein FtsN
MNQYLLSILKEVNTIIIPGIGALTITNPSTGEIMFMPFLKFDDGKLAQHISEKEGMDINDAKNLIAKYVREIEAQLNIGESYDMYQFGSFLKNSEGEIEFKPWNGEKESVNPEVVIDDSINESEPEPTTDTSIDANDIIPETIDEAPIIIAPEIDSDPSNEEESSQTAEEIQETEPQEELDIALSSTEFVSEETITPILTEIPQQTIPEPAYTEEQQWNDDLDLPPINAKIERPKKPIIEKVQKDKKRKSPAKVILLTLLFLVIGGGTTVILMRDQLGITIPFLSASKESTEVKTTISTKSTVEEETSTETETTEIDETIEKPATETPVDSEIEEQSVSNTSAMIQTSTGSVNPSQPFHVIAGAFKEKSNAERFRDRLRENGNSNSEIIGEFDGLFIVSVTSHSNMQEAQESQKTNTTISKSWIFRFP